LYGFAAFAVASLAGCGGGGSSSGVIAKVGDHSITRDQYLKQLETMDEIAVVLENGQSVQARPAQPLSVQALSKLVERQTVAIAANKAGVMPSKDDVEAEKKLRMTLNPDFLNQSKAIGLSTEDVDNLLRTELAVYRLQVRKQPEKTIADAEKYVKDNPKQFERPAQVAFRWIVLTDASKRSQVDRALANSTFGAVAAEYSTMTTAKQDNGAFNSGGGLAPRPTPITALQGPLQTAAQATGEGRTSEWFQMEGRWIKIKVESKTKAQAVTPSKGQLELLRRELTRRDAKGANDLNKTLLDTLLATKVDVMPSYLKKNWESLVTALKQRIGGQASAAAPSGVGSPTIPKTP
jgi:hypothetical protein